MFASRARAAVSGGAKMVLHLDAAVGVTGTNPVTQWDSIVGGHVYTKFGGNDLTWNPTGVNGLPTIRAFNNTTRLVGPPGEDIFGADPPGGEVIFVCFQEVGADQDPHYGALFRFSPGGNMNHIPLGAQVYSQFGSTSRMNGPAAANMIDEWQILNFAQDGAVQTNYKNGVSYLSEAATVGWWTSSHILGDGRGGHNQLGSVAEIIGYDRALTSAERTAIVNSLKTKYAIP